MRVKGGDIVELKSGEQIEVFDIVGQFIQLKNGRYVKRSEVVKVVETYE